MQIKDFNQKQRNKRNVIIGISCILIGAIILVVGSSFALFQKEDEIKITNGTARYPNASEVKYETDHNGDVHSVQDAIEDLHTQLDK